MDIYKKYNFKDCHLSGYEVASRARLRDILGKKNLPLAFKSDRGGYYFGGQVNKGKVKKILGNNLEELSTCILAMDRSYLSLVHLEVTETNTGYAMNTCFTLKQGGYSNELLLFDSHYNLLGVYSYPIKKAASILLYSILLYCTKDYAVDKFTFGLEMDTAAVVEVAKLDKYYMSEVMYEGVRLRDGKLEYLLLM